MTLGSIIKQYRADNKISMQDFADACELSKAYISLLERDIRPQNGKKIIPSIETLSKIANGLKISLDVLVKQLDEDSEVVIEDIRKKTDNAYILDKDAAEMLRSLSERPELKVLLDASRELSKDDVEAVTRLISRK